MKGSDDLAAFCTELLALNRILFDTGHLEAAYHALEAALHCADDRSDAPALRRIEAVAAEEHRRVTQYVRSALSNSATPQIESAHWVSLEGIYAIAVRQASIKASEFGLRDTSDLERGA